MEQNKELKQETYSSYDELYKSITKEGSLGLLALGYRGLLLWRQKRKELENQSSDGTKTNETSHDNIEK